MSIHFKVAGDLMRSALLPDRTIGGFVSAALDGSGKTSKLSAAFRGLGEDAYELPVNSFKAGVAVIRGVSENL